VNRKPFVLLLGCVLAAGFGCSRAALTRCGSFLSEPGVSCPESGYLGVAKTESGREREGVYHFYNSGSGVFIDKSGLLVTASHVVNHKRRIAVFIDGDDTAYAAEPLDGCTFEDLDLSFLRVVSQGRRVRHGCIFSGALLRKEFPEVRLPGSDDPGLPIGCEVQVVGYPNEKPRALGGRIIDPRAKFARYVAENKLGPYAAPEGTALQLPPLGPDAPESLTQLLDGLHTLKKRMRQGFLFVELESSHRQSGISGGAVMRGDELVGIPIESWNSFEKTILIAFPAQKLPLLRAQPDVPAAPDP
jgi:hypothetical protein